MRRQQGIDPGEQLIFLIRLGHVLIHAERERLHALRLLATSKDNAAAHARQNHCA